MPSTREFVLTTDERSALETRARSRRGRADAARRAQVILLLADRVSYGEITVRVGWSSATIAKWKTQCLADRVGGLTSRHWGSQPRTLTPRLEAKILARTQRPPSDGSTHCSTRKLATALGIQHTMVARVWQRAGLQPHRLERYVRSTDPDFERKAADIIDLYLAPPRHAAVFCLDEKTSVQALDRRDPVLPLSPGRAERHGFEYLAPRHVVPLCGAQYPDRRGVGADRAAPH